MHLKKENVIKQIKINLIVLLYKVNKKHSISKLLRLEKLKMQLKLKQQRWKKLIPMLKLQ